MEIKKLKAKVCRRDDEGNLVYCKNQEGYECFKLSNTIYFKRPDGTGEYYAYARKINSIIAVTGKITYQCNVLTRFYLNEIKVGIYFENGTMNMRFE